MLSSVTNQLGPFRVTLAVATLLLALTAPFALGESHYHDWRILPTVVAPVFAVMLMFLLPLDMLMSWVFARGDPTRAQRLHLVIRTEAVLMVVLLLSWWSFLSALAPN